MISCRIAASGFSERFGNQSSSTKVRDKTSSLFYNDGNIDVMRRETEMEIQR